MDESEKQNDDTPGSGEKSEIASRIERLRGSALGAARTRERLPQPLFWSLFFFEIDEIRAKKEQKRLERRLIFGDTIL